MEQQSISISKVGIVSSLQDRYTEIPAVNPITGRYDSRLSFDDNVELTELILSLFEFILLVSNTIEPIIDETISYFCN